MQGDVEARMNQVGDGAAVRAYVSEHLDQMLAELIGWVRLRSVAGLPEHQPDLQRSANWLAGALREVGFPTAEVWETEGAPAVYAEWCEAPGAPTVLIYSHHDVRAAKDETWGQVPPFEPALRDGRLWAAGHRTRRVRCSRTSGDCAHTWRRPGVRRRR